MGQTPQGGVQSKATARVTEVKKCPQQIKREKRQEPGWSNRGGEKKGATEKREERIEDRDSR